MNDLLMKVFDEGVWKPLRFTVYNYLEENEYYQQKLEKLGYGSTYEELEGKTIMADNVTAKRFKMYIENAIQNGNVIVAICVLDNSDYFTVVKPKDVDILSILNTSQS